MAPSKLVHYAFERSYQQRYHVGPPAIKGVASSYDAVYVLAYALSAADEDPLHKPTALAAGLRQLTGGPLTFTTGTADLDDVLTAVAARKPLTLVGTLGELSWTMQGALRQGSVGTLCLGLVDDHWSFVDTGYSYDVGEHLFSGSDKGCADTGRQAAARNAEPDAQQKPKEPEVVMPAAAGTKTSAPDAGAPAGHAAMPESMPVTQAPEPERAMDIGLAVRYRPLNTTPSDSVISFALQIVNRSASDPVKLSSLTLRYYFDNEHSELCPSQCVVEGFYAGIQPAGMAISAKRESDASADNRAHAYIDVTFPGSPIALGVGESVEVQQQFHTEPYRPLDESNDYSFRAKPDSLQDWDHVTLRRDGVLVWGVPPEL
jgi:hypothetical protein